ncbi:YdeI/OmpD-associated family protein [Blastomonas sp. UPD001]|uniref:YdeI/OmpD-associated family protein n=1 Tax=Blastomonas sp. UPD001 TaxID=2217673 RepID=UPI000E3473B4|nr:YdeI/OmpD-associated family protein [Blastomonas sp. UPD001]
MIADDRFERLQITAVGELRDWLAENHAHNESVWLVTFKKHVTRSYVSRFDVLDELLCFGWVDGIRRKLDADRTMQLISPRRAEIWTATYKARAAQLEIDGRMAEPGRAAIARSRAAGLWNAHAYVDAVIEPPDLVALLNVHPQARAWWEAAAPSYRRNILRWIAGAVAPETRARRIQTLVDLCTDGRKMPNM